MPPSPTTIDAAFEYLFPIIEMARTRHLLIESPANPRRQPPGAFNHRRVLADHRARAVTTPNNDTLYSSAWLDLDTGPWLLSVPRIPDRYWSLAMMDLFTNHFGLLGSRLEGDGPVQALIVGPQWAGVAPADLRVIRAPTRDVWLLGRWLVDGEADLPAVHAIQDALKLSPWGEHRARIPQAVAPADSRDPAGFLAVANEMLGRNPVPAHERDLLAGWAPLGVRPGDTAVWARLHPTVREAWTSRIDALHEPLREGFARGSRTVGGWQYPPDCLGNYGTRYDVRAAVALGGLAALEPVEALYLGMSRDAEGRALSGERRHRLAIPAGGLATEAFWSLSMYEETPQGRLYFTANPIGRYTIGDRTPGLVPDADGAFEVVLQHERPNDAGQAAHWLPTPSGPFQLTLRAYLPREALRQGLAPLPRLITG